MRVAIYKHSLVWRYVGNKSPFYMTFSASFLQNSRVQHRDVNVGDTRYERSAHTIGYGIIWEAKLRGDAVEVSSAKIFPGHVRARAA